MNNFLKHLFFLANRPLIRTPNRLTVILFWLGYINSYYAESLDSGYLTRPSHRNRQTLPVTRRDTRMLFICGLIGVALGSFGVLYTDKRPLTLLGVFAISYLAALLLIAAVWREEQYYKLIKYLYLLPLAAVSGSYLIVIPVLLTAIDVSPFIAVPLTFFGLHRGLFMLIIGRQLGYFRR